MRNLILLCFSLFFGGTIFAQSAVGKWTTIDDKTNTKKSTVEIYKYEGKLYGKVIYLYPRKGRPEHPVCDKCTDDRKGKPIVGMQIIRGLKWDGEEWEGGTICDPEIGKVYRTKIWVDPNNPNKLQVRGYLGPFFRTQTWLRVED